MPKKFLKKINISGKQYLKLSKTLEQTGDVIVLSKIKEGRRLGAHFSLAASLPSKWTLLEPPPGLGLKWGQCHEGSTTLSLLSNFERTEVHPTGFVAGLQRATASTRLRATSAARASPAQVPTRPLGAARSGSPLARPRGLSALSAARQRHRHAEIPEVPPRRSPSHAAARPSPPPSAHRALGFPVHPLNPLLLGATQRHNRPRTPCQLHRAPRLFPSQAPNKRTQRKLTRTATQNSDPKPPGFNF